MLLLKRFLLAAALLTPALAADITGPSSSQRPYLLPSQPGVVTMSVLTVGDSVNGYAMTGIPDGLGAFDNGDGTFTLLMNQELGNTRGVVRAHGSAGAFVSRWVIEKETLTVASGEDLIKELYLDDGSGNYVLAAPGAGALNRLCSADLPALTAFYNPTTGLGYNGRIFLNGEESTGGRAFAHLMNGKSYELRALGKINWENSVAHPNTGDKTVVLGTDDTAGGQVVVYVGTKGAFNGDAIAAAGLKNGARYGVKVVGMDKEDDATGITSAPFVALDLAQPANIAPTKTFNRPEDGAWDPSNPADFYFVTTASFTGKSRLWRLRFTDVANPELGGVATVILAGTEGPRMMDNITISKRGSIFIQEDPGNQAHLAKIWRYGIRSRTLEVVAEHDSTRFLTGGLNFLTQDEESSGIIPMAGILGEGWYLAVVQAHYATTPELVEGGQLVALHFPPGREKK